LETGFQTTFSFSFEARFLGTETLGIYKFLRTSSLDAKTEKCATLEARKYLTGLRADVENSTSQLSRRKR
jgi:hypothetical protein